MYCEKLAGGLSYDAMFGRKTAVYMASLPDAAAACVHTLYLILHVQMQYFI